MTIRAMLKGRYREPEGVKAAAADSIVGLSARTVRVGWVEM